jgi:electron transport complex protein RnfE
MNTSPEGWPLAKPERSELTRLMIDGLWQQNPALVGLLGLCPLLAAGNSLIHGLALGMATTWVLALASALISLLRGRLPDGVRLPLFMLILATVVSLLDRLMEAGFPTLHGSLGLFIPLIITNCVILSRLDRGAYRNPPGIALWSGLWMGLGFSWVLCVLGAIREVIGQGQLLGQADQLFGASAERWTLTLFDGYPGFSPALMPTGAFLLLGLMLAARNQFSAIGARRAEAAGPPAEALRPSQKP